MHANGLKNIEVTDLELNSKKRLYAIDAFRLIEERYKGEDIFFIMGADNFVNIVKWKNANELIEKYKYIVLERENINIEEHINNKLKDRVYIIKNDDYNTCSSNEFRSILREEKRYKKDIIPDEVIDYIIKNDLFLI